MFRLFGLAFGLALGFGIAKQGFDTGGSLLAVGLGVIAAVVLAYYAGRRRRPSAVAVASASAVAAAEASAHAQQAVVVNVSLGARETAKGVFGDLDDVEWQRSGEAAEIIDADVYELEGPERALDLAPLMRPAMSDARGRQEPPQAAAGGDAEPLCSAAWRRDQGSTWL